MNELLDKIIIRIILTVFVLLVLFLYKYIHTLIFPSSRPQLLKRFYPEKNIADTLHLFGRILGTGLIFSEFYFYISQGILIGIFDFVIISLLGFFLYLCSMYIIESIVLYNFEYRDEVLKRKNISYSIICFSHAIGLALIIKTGIFVAKDSIHHIPIYLIFLWLFAMVMVGFATKSYSLISPLYLNKLLQQKNMGVGLSYSGFFLAWVLIISHSLNHELNDIKNYTIQAILKILLGLIIFPIFKKGLVVIFRIQPNTIYDSENKDKIENPDTGFGLYEGIIFITSALLTTVITGNILFGEYYPTL